MFIGSELERYRHLVTQNTAEAFAVKCDGFYFHGEIAQDSPEGKLDFYTGVVHIDSRSKGKTKTERPSRHVIEPGEFLVRFDKKKDNEWTEWFRVGRANNNDVVIRHPSISKLHARISTTMVDPMTGEECAMWISDMGSANGTVINDMKLEPSTKFPLAPGDALQFGDVKAHFVDATLLYERLL